MSLRSSITTADYLPWEQMIVLSQRLERDKQFVFALLIQVGAYTGLRISDLLQLRYEQFIGKSHIHITERKTKKNRTIKINNELQQNVLRIFKQTYARPSDLLLRNNKTGKAFSIQYINRKLKDFKRTYRLSIKQFSTHTLRKTFGRRIWEGSGYSERAITMLSEIFNHSSFRITRRYLGINAEEIEQIYDLL